MAPVIGQPSVEATGHAVVKTFVTVNPGNKLELIGHNPLWVTVKNTSEEHVTIAVVLPETIEMERHFTMLGAGEQKTRVIRRKEGDSKIPLNDTVKILWVSGSSVNKAKHGAASIVLPVVYKLSKVNM